MAPSGYSLSMSLTLFLFLENLLDTTVSHSYAALYSQRSRSALSTRLQTGPDEPNPLASGAIDGGLGMHLIRKELYMGEIATLFTFSTK